MGKNIEKLLTLVLSLVIFINCFPISVLASNTVGLTSDEIEKSITGDISDNQPSDEILTEVVEKEMKIQKLI